MPIASNLVALGFVGMFIGVMFKLIIFSLFLLSAIMMNNMFRVAVERKSFDFALLKVMGADRVFIVANILTGALRYVVFANLIAYPLSYLALGGITSVRSRTSSATGTRSPQPRMLCWEDSSLGCWCPWYPQWLPSGESFRMTWLKT